jgi:hypothetical protein
MLVGKILVVLNLFFVSEPQIQAQEEVESEVADEEVSPTDQGGDGSPDSAPQGADTEKSAASAAQPETVQEPAPEPSQETETAGEVSHPDAASAGGSNSVTNQGSTGVSESPLEGVPNQTEQALPPSEENQVATAAHPPGADPAAQGVNPILYVFGGFAGVIGLFSLYTFYRRKKTWDEISDAMRIDGGDTPLGSQPPSEFNTQDIAGISNTQVSKPISELND